MCGITGFIEYTPRFGQNIIDLMTDSLEHRGPDSRDTKIWNSKYARIAFGHRRLSIIDLSESGKQPKSKSNWHITFNGEIYNYKEIRSELITLGHTFDGASDTEVILSSLQQWGIDCIQKFIGMFAFAAYNSDQNIIYLVRDRAGIKPLYYYTGDTFIAFGSELKAILKYPTVENKISSQSVAQYFECGYIKAPQTIYQNCNQLEAGNYLRLNLSNKTSAISKYWDPYTATEKQKVDLPEHEYLKETESIMLSAFKYRMVSDVPVGVFLSGGYDSTLVATLLQINSTEKLKTYTIGFDNQKYDESKHAKKVADFLKTDHTTIPCSVNDAKEIIPKLPTIFDEPFGDSSAIPTYLVSKIAKKHVKVALSADGGDEQFVGYNRYINSVKLASKITKTPRFLKSALSHYFKSSNKLTTKARVNHKIYEILTSNNLSLIPSIQTKIMFETELKSLIIDFKKKDVTKIFGDNEDLNLLFASEYSDYLQNDILTKVDRASMAVGLEARDPLLDHRIAEWALRTPLKYKYKNKTLKYPIKKIVHKHIPRELVDRKKQGFGIPIIDWLKSDLSYLIRDLITEKKIKEQGLLNWDYVNSKLKMFFSSACSGDTNTFIWLLLVFQMWHEEWILKSK